MRLVVLAALAVGALALASPVLGDTSGVVTVTSLDGLNLRSAPNTGAPVVAVIPYGSVLSVTGAATPDQWYPVSFGNLSGWADGAYLTPGIVNPLAAQTAPAISAPAPATSGATVVASTLAVAPAPAPVTAGVNVTAPATSPAATGVNVVAAPAIAPPLSTAVLLPVSAQPGSLPTPAVPAIGSTPPTPPLLPISSSAVPLNPIAATGTTSTSASTSATMLVNTNMLNVRTAPNMSGLVLVTLPQGTVVQVTGPATANNWYPVLYNTISGWADGTYLSAAATAPTPAPITGLTASAFGNPTLGTPAGPETGLPVAVAPPLSPGQFIWPVTSRRISTVFQPVHQAVDIDQFPAGGNPVVAIASGIVTFAGGDPCCSYGLYVMIQHAGGFSSLYAHFSKLEVTQGQMVQQGQELGRSGCTGNCTGPHVHFAIYYHDDPLDPLTVLPPGAQIEPTAHCYLAC